MKEQADISGIEHRYERIIAVGDLHGHCDPLKKLLAVIDPGMNDLLVFIGDYVDRGPYSNEVLGTLIDFRSTYKSTVFLKGNHEDMMLGSMGYPAGVEDLNTWLYNGGGLTLQSYGMKKGDFRKLSSPEPGEDTAEIIRCAVPDRHLEFLLELSPYLETERFFFCHAGVDPHASIQQGKHNGFDLLWMRDHIYARDLRWEKTVVCGHTPLREVMIRDLLICVDTGLYYYGKLSAVDVLSGEVYAVTM